MNHTYLRRKRLFDLLLALFLTLLLIIPVILLVLLIKLTSKGPILYWSERIGVNNELFNMPKFRTMLIDTPELPTHLLNDPERYLTTIGAFLRKTSLDEIPQLYSILIGDMSFVGPRPALYNQEDLKELRSKKGVHMLTPGLTGWAQVNGRDELSIEMKVHYDEEYLHQASLLLDLKIMFYTLFKVLKKEGIKH
ncbi:MAG: sugar transferase [Nitrospinae bacterium]|nr:sugar transferase [Nitrospinota bacterium]